MPEDPLRAEWSERLDSYPHRPVAFARAAEMLRYVEGRFSRAA